MSEQRRGSLPPYMKGGVPGALTALMACNAVLSVLLGCFTIYLAVLSMIRGSFWPGLAGLVGCVSYVPFILQGIGAVRARRGDCDGAGMVATGYSFQRVLAIISLVTVIITGLYVLFQNLSRLGVLVRYAPAYTIGYIAGNLTAYAAAICLSAFSIKYLGELRDTARSVRRDMRFGAGESPSYAPVVPVGWSVFFGIVCFLAAIGFGLSTGLRLPGYDRAGYLQTVISLDELISLCLFLFAAQYLVLAGFLRGFRRSHTGIDPQQPAFQPAGYVRAPVLSVLGTILLSWMAFSNVLRPIQLLFTGSFLNALWYLDIALSVAAFVVLAVALLHPKRTLLTIVGSALMVVCLGIRLGTQLQSFPLAADRLRAVLNLISVVVNLLFYLLLAAAAVTERLRGGLPRALRLLLVIFAAASVAAMYAGSVMTSVELRLAAVAVVIDLLLAAAVLTARLALALAHSKEEPEPPADPDAFAKEAAPGA